MSDDHTKLCHPGECRDCEARRARATQQLLDEHADKLADVIIQAEPTQPSPFAVPRLDDEQREALQASVTETLRALAAMLRAVAEATANAAKGFAAFQDAFALAPPPAECQQHPNAPRIGGMCGGCTQYPSDMTKEPRP